MAGIDLFDAIHSARALRRLKPDPVPDEIITRIIDAAIRAPSGSNEQKWVFVVVTDPEQRRKVAEIYRRAAEKARLADYVAAKFQSPGGNERQKRLIAKSVIYLAEHMDVPPVLIVACLNSGPSPWGRGADRMARLEGASIYPAVQNIILAARAFGLGTVLTTLHVILEDELKSILGLPPEITTWALLPVGYPEGKHGPVSRKPVQEVACRNSWGHPWHG